MSALDEEWNKKTEVADRDARSLGDAKNLQQAFMAYFAKQIGVGAGSGTAGTKTSGAGRGRARKAR